MTGRRISKRMLLVLVAVILCEQLQLQLHLCAAKNIIPDLSRTTSDSKIRAKNITKVADLFIGQKVVDINKFAFVVSIGRKSDGKVDEVNHLCSGILLDRQFVLTSGSCARRTEAENFEIRLGSLQSESIAVARNVDQVIQNDIGSDGSHGLSHSSEGYNVAIFKLDKPVEDGIGISRALLLLDDTEENDLDRLVTEEAVCTAAGFGLGQMGRPGGWGELVQYNMSLSAWTPCQSAYNNTYHHDFHICVSNDGYKEKSCFYEDGAPLVCGGKIYGLYVFQGSGKECAENLVVFNRIDKLYPFVEKTLREKKAVGDRNHFAIIKSSDVLPLKNMRRDSVCVALRRPPSGEFNKYCLNVSSGECCPAECYPQTAVRTMKKLDLMTATKKPFKIMDQSDVRANYVSKSRADVASGASLVYVTALLHRLLTTAFLTLK